VQLGCKDSEDRRITLPTAVVAFSFVSFHLHESERKKKGLPSLFTAGQQAGHHPRPPIDGEGKGRERGRREKAMTKSTEKKMK
jgi:hypothetical protein